MKAVRFEIYEQIDGSKIKAIKLKNILYENDILYKRKQDYTNFVTKIYMRKIDVMLLRDG